MTMPAAFLLLIAATVSSPAYTGQEYAKDAKIDIAHARQLALRVRPGIVTDQELEPEGGGTGLRYSFDIKRRGKTYEVGVDARTGRILENSKEGLNPD